MQRPGEHLSATSASATGTNTVGPLRKLQASPSATSWAKSTGPRAQDRSPRNDQAHRISRAPNPRKKPAVVTPIVTRPEVSAEASSTPYPTRTRPSTATSEAARISGVGVREVTGAG